MTLQPVAMFNLGMTNPDVLVVAVTAWIAFVLVRVWRTTPKWRHAVAIGALLGLGLVAKINFLVVLPVVALLQVLVWSRARRSGFRARAWQLATTAGVAAAMFLSYVVVNATAWDRALRFQSNVQPELDANAREMLSYVWQTFLPPLPFMTRFWEGGPVVIDNVLVGATSRFGHWNDYGLSEPWPAVLIGFCSLLVAGGVVLAVRAARYRRAAALAAMAAGIYVLLVVVSLFGPSIAVGPQLQARYLLPLAPIWALATGAAIAVLPSRWQPLGSAALALVMVGWSVLAIGATLERFYL